MKAIHKRYLLVVGTLFITLLIGITYYKSGFYHGRIKVSPYGYPHGIEYFWALLMVSVIGLKYIAYDSIAHAITGSRKKKLLAFLFYAGFTLTLLADAWLIFQSSAPLPDAGYLALQALVFTPIILASFLIALMVFRNKTRHTSQ